MSDTLGGSETEDEEPQAPFAIRLHAYGGHFTPSEELLIRELVARPADAWVLTAAELANRVGVHESTAVRLAKKLGYGGYRELRAELQAGVSTTGQIDFGKRFRRRLKEDDSLARLVADEIRALKELPGHVSQDALGEAAHILNESHRVFLFGQHHATVIIEFLGRRLRRLGFEVIDLRYKGRDLAERVSTLRAGDAVLACAFKVQPPGLAPLLKHANTVGAKCVIITDLFGATFRPPPTLMLSARFGADQYFQTTVVPLVIAYALILAIARSDGGRSVESLERLDQLTMLYENED